MMKIKVPSPEVIEWLKKHHNVKETREQIQLPIPEYYNPDHHKNPHSTDQEEIIVISLV